ncbi:MAG: phosphoglucosamine mutase [Anaerolineae bacterium]|nr:phosphoglucosamine mutase [Anaerolineae bacterium]
MQTLFGTDGIRGTTDRTETSRLRLTPGLSLSIGQAIGELVWHELAGEGENVVVIGRDPRISGWMIENALTAGLLAQGVDVVQAGIIPTPGVAVLLKQLGARAGIVISASHNPAEDNGIKVFGPDGYKLSDEFEDFVQSRVPALDQLVGTSKELTGAQDPAGGSVERLGEVLRQLGKAPVPRDTRELGSIRAGVDAEQRYIDYLVQLWQGHGDLSGKLVLVECANGAGSFIAPEVFLRLGASVGVINGSPDGHNINESYEYLDPRRFRQEVLDAGADVGIALDGDADRVLLLDEEGQVIDGDVIMAILARDMLARGRLAHRTVVTTNMSNLGLHESLDEVGARVVETQVGDRYVLAEMLAHGYTLGGERSGHILILDGEQTTGDGIHTALAVLGAWASQPGARLSELASVMPKHPQFIGSAAIEARPKLEEVEPVQEILARLRGGLGEKADINLRYSGTEYKIRLSVRGSGDDDPELIDRQATEALGEITQAISDWSH